MTNALYTIAKGALPQSSDVNQFPGTFSATIDAGLLQLATAATNPSTAPTATSNGTGNLTGNYGWCVTGCVGTVESNGTLNIIAETLPSPVSNSLALSSGQAQLSNIAVTGTTFIAWRAYRNKSAGSPTTGPFYLVTTQPNTTTTFPDNVPDSSLGALAPTANSTGTSFAESTMLGYREMIPDYDQYMSSPDGNDIYTVVTLKRQNGTTYFVSTLSNPNGSGFYQTDTWQFYDSAGTTVITTHVWSITYDANGRKTQAVMTS